MTLYYNMSSVHVIQIMLTSFMLGKYRLIARYIIRYNNLSYLILIITEV